MHSKTMTYLMENDAGRYQRHDLQRRYVADDFETNLNAATHDHPLDADWAGFTDEIMGGRSTAEVYQDNILGKGCLHVQGDVTCEDGGGFVQVAMHPANDRQFFDVSDYAGLQILVLGNNQKYNVHLRTSDCRFHEQSYRKTFFAPARWERLCFTWSDFTPHGLAVPFNPQLLQRVGVLGWMRDFHMDLAIGEVAFFA
jgi:hypothetical protein